MHEVTEIVLAQVSAGEIDMKVAQAGAGDPVVLLHGFPELWYSWRHQLSALASAGYRAIAPNQRGYEGSPGPEQVERYDIVALTGDLVGLLDALELDQAVVIGHDWGAAVAWAAALRHPDRVRAVGGLSVPHTPRPPVRYTDFWRQTLGDAFYMLWLQRPGEADDAFAADIPRALAGGWVTDRTGWTDAPLSGPPPWQSGQDLTVYVEALERSGFTAPLNWYRNFDRNWELMAPFDGVPIEQPALFVVGDDDPVRQFMPPELMQGLVSELRELVVLEGVSHWPQQEAPEAVNEVLLRFLSGLRAA